MTIIQPSRRKKAAPLFCLGVLVSVLLSVPSSAQEPGKARAGMPTAPRVPAGVTAHRDLPYVVDGHERHKLDLFVPEKSDGPLPLLIWVHGGGWQNGSKEGCPPLRNGYTASGFAVASINYRLSGHATFPAQIEDCKAAIRWLRAHAREYNLDAERFGVWGSSAGGHLVALIGTTGGVQEFDTGANLDQSSRVQAVCDYYGPTDFTVFVTTPGYERHATADSPESKLLGGAVMENRDKAARANPITYVSQDDPPFLIVHGDQDGTVPINQSQLLFELLRKAGVSVRFHTIKNAGHGNGFGGPEIEPMVREFFEQHLKSKSPPSNLGEAKTSESVASATGFTPPGKPSLTPPIGRPSITWEEVCRREGINEDGRVTREQFRGPPPLFDRLDRNRDGVLTREDFAESTSAASSTPPVTDARGFQLDGQRWTYRDGDFAMSGILLKPEGQGPFPAVLISHGLGGSAESFGLNKAREMVKWGFVCVAPDYTHTRTARSNGPKADKSEPASPRGGTHPPDYGASTENIRRARTCLELVSKMPEVDAKRLFAYGHSMGGFVTIGLAASAPDLLQAAAITGSGIAPREGFPAPSAASAEKIRTPFLMLHGSADAVVRPQQSVALKAVLDLHGVPNQRRVLENAGHPIDQSHREEVFAEVKGWFAEHGAQKP
jgi:acetyl esterase/lipase